MKDINEIYDDRVHKLTINIPLVQYDLIAQATRKGTKYLGRKGVFIREAINEKLQRMIVDERPPSKEEYESLLKTGKPADPPHRFSGFIDGLLSNSFKWAWFRKKQLDKIGM